MSSSRDWDGREGGGRRAEPRGLEAGGGGKEESAKEGPLGRWGGDRRQVPEAREGACQEGGPSSFVTAADVGETSPGSRLGSDTRAPSPAAAVGWLTQGVMGPSLDELTPVSSLSPRLARSRHLITVQRHHF